MATKASAWKSKSKTRDETIQLPSGNECLVRPIKPEAFLESGMIPDALSSMVMKAVNSKKGLPPSKVQELANDPKKLAAAMELFDRALVYCVIEPPVEMAPACEKEGCGESYTGGDAVHVDRKHKDYHKYVEGERDPDVLYADVVDMEDKMHIFQWAVGGVGDVAKFRGELQSTMDAVDTGDGVQDSA
jgi:hypothetical protein